MSPAQERAEQWRGSVCHWLTGDEGMGAVRAAFPCAAGGMSAPAQCTQIPGTHLMAKSARS